MTKDEKIAHQVQRRIRFAQVGEKIVNLDKLRGAGHAVLYVGQGGDDVLRATRVVVGEDGIEVDGKVVYRFKVPGIRRIKALMRASSK